jgi:DNA-binding response OmpR family regulator
MRILVIEDQTRLSDNIKQLLVDSGFAVDQAFDGQEGEFLAVSENYDCIILDIMLPELDGISVCKSIRGKKIKTPILMLTAKSSVEDITEGLDSGADDYLTKPFSFVELRSRIQALLRRSYGDASIILSVGDLELDPVKHMVMRKGKKIGLTPKEFAILEFLLRHKDEAVTRTMIIEHVWDMNFDSMSNVIDAFIATLRKKVDKGFAVKLIHTLRGVGFRISQKP